jgi:hypothetical protein
MGYPIPIRRKPTGAVTMDKIRITSKDMRPKTVEFIRPDGTRLDKVAACDIKLRPDAANKATIWLNVDEIDIEAELLLAFDTVSEAARRYGYKLVVIQPDKEKP